MKNNLLAAVVAFVFNLTCLAGTKVPVDVGEGIVTVTIPLVVSDEWVVIKMFGEKDVALKKAEIRGYSVKVYYPEEWELSSKPEGNGRHAVTFKMGNRLGNPSVSLEMDLKNPLNSLDKKERDHLLPQLEEVFGSRAKGLTFSPARGLVEWEPTENKELQKVAGRTPWEEELLAVEIFQLPDQSKDLLPFKIRKSPLILGVSTEEKLPAITDLAPFLSQVKESPIRARDGFLEKREGQWIVIRSKTVIGVVPYLEYYIAEK